MKKISLLLIFLSVMIHAQQENFFIENRQLYWQKIYEGNNDIEKLKSTFTRSGKISVDDSSPEYFKGEIRDFVMDYKGAGSTLMGTPGYLNEQNKFFANYKVEIKDGRYRVTVSNIRLKGLELNYGMIRDDGNDNVEEYALTSKGDAIKKRFLGRESKIINYSFSQLFSNSEYKEPKSDW